MKATFTIVICALVFTLAAWPQDEAEYAKNMKSINVTNKSLRANMMAKNGEGAAKDAKALAEAFGQAEKFWKQRGTEDAVQSTLAAKNAFEKVAELAAAGKFEEAVEPMKVGGGQCMSCHNAHRERLPDGSYKIK